MREKRREERELEREREAQAKLAETKAGDKVSDRNKRPVLGKPAEAKPAEPKPLPDKPPMRVGLRNSGAQERSATPPVGTPTTPALAEVSPGATATAPSSAVPVAIVNNTTH